ncbi:MAG: helix-turn-helix domain-containing protein [Candidatus Bathyarchaeota archaeon]|nr:helix-turn-helix domain-containing protein [Candidatus Bathyarchaeota archaeon]MDH5495153.1 helix-turn-helix domain-containing protein [Candidatus Bathyarchaeota archaeon]
MSGYPLVSPRPELPEEFRFLCMLHNVGAIKAEGALTIEKIAKWTNKETSTIQEYLRKLEALGYVQSVKRDGANRYHVSVMGIRKVLTLYS